VPISILLVAIAIELHKLKLSPKLGPKTPGNPLRSISCATSIVRCLRPGTAARLTAGNCVIASPQLVIQLVTADLSPRALEAHATTNYAAACLVAGLIVSLMALERRPSRVAVVQ